MVCDIGGTNARFTLWEVAPDGSSSEVLVDIVPTAKHEPESADGFMNLLREKLDSFSTPGPKAACIAVAGPVQNNLCQMTNLGWRIDGAAISEEMGVPTSVINDFEAVGYGIPALHEEDLHTLHDAPVEPQGPVAVLGPGTGLGEAQVLWDEGLQEYKVWPSEGSHADFAPRGWKQRALLDFCEDECDGHCELEFVACGSGLERIYRFLCTDQPSHAPHVCKGDAMSSECISRAAAEGSDPIAVEALDIFLSILGQEAGHMALRCMASGGVYIAGGILPKNMHRLEAGGLVDGYLNKASRFSQVIEKIKLVLVMNPHVGLIGARECAIRLLK